MSYGIDDVRSNSRGIDDLGVEMSVLRGGRSCVVTLF
jgi:hypothetical protein